MTKIIICFLLAAFFKAVMDKLQFHGLLEGNPLDVIKPALWQVSGTGDETMMSGQFMIEKL